MKKIRKKYVALRALLFIGVAALLWYLLPTEERSKYTYEENRPWAYQLLTAPFDIPVYLDTISAQAIKDSIDATFEPIYKRDPEREKAILSHWSELLSMTSSKITLRQRALLTEEIKSIYDRGIVDLDTYMKLRDGQLAGLRTIADNEAKSIPPGSVYSSRTAYTRLDSMVKAHNLHDALITSSLAEVLRPNLIADTAASDRFLAEAYQSALAPIGVVQRGERIIDRGDIVSPRLYTILRTFESISASRGGQISVDRYYTGAGQALYLMFLLGALYAYLYFYRRDYFSDFRKLLFVVIMVALFAAFAMLMPADTLSGIYIVPFTIVIVTVQVFLDSRTAFFTYLVTILISVLMARFPIEFITVEFLAGLVGLVSLKDLSRRSQLLRAALYILVCYCVVYTAIEIMQTGSVVRLSGSIFGGFAINAVTISFAYVLIFIVEKLFGFTSKVTLVELSDINNPLLRELSEECPGTFQHSMAVSTLATAAALRIGADVQMVRAGALYHDIGKIGNPAFFTENQHGVNPHDGLDPRQSASIVIGHVANGLKMAEKANIPECLRNFISEHHGAGRARYFYTTYCNTHPDEEVDPAPFTYPGPNPRSRETSILMMADAVEAAARSLDDHSIQSISALVNKIIDQQVAEGLHNDSTISFRDVRDIKDSFISRLRGIYHARVSYPEAKSKATADTVR